MARKDKQTGPAVQKVLAELDQAHRKLARLVKEGAFIEMVRRKRSDLGTYRAGSITGKVVRYLNKHPGPHRLSEIMAAAGTKNRQSLAVTMVRLKDAGVVDGSERGGGFRAVRR